MNRTTAREIAVQILFGDRFSDVNLDDFLSEEHFDALSEECSLYKGSGAGEQAEYIRSIIENYRSHALEIDGIISEYSKTRAINRISGTALAVLRCALTEILYLEDVPDAAAINAAVEIDKGYDEEETVSFVNGILGSFMRSRNE